MKPISFLGDSLRCLRAFPAAAKQDAGYQLDRLQNGLQPLDFRPMPLVGRGVEEIRLHEEQGAFRVIYTARLADAIYVLHVFQKKTQATAKSDIDLAKARYSELMREFS